MAWSNLTHQLYHSWGAQNLRGRSLLLLLSGGVDSLALFYALRDLSGPLGFSWASLHLHHGGNSLYREGAARFCRDLGARFAVPSFEARSDHELHAEQEMREFRRARAENERVSRGFDFLLTGHHADDVLETRFFRVLRGTGLQGLEAMRERDGVWWRPLLAYSRKDLEQDLVWRGVQAFEDPSNQDLSYKRNWLRGHLFREIETEMPGALCNLASFFSQVVDQVQANSTLDFPVQDWVRNGGIPRSWFLQRSASEQKQALACYLFELGVKNYRHTQIEEVLKHLDKSKIVHTLVTAGCEWFLNEDQILALPRGERLEERI